MLIKLVLAPFFSLKLLPDDIQIPRRSRLEGLRALNWEHRYLYGLLPPLDNSTCTMPPLGNTNNEPSVHLSEM
jgi:hypothetical protein